MADETKADIRESTADEQIELSKIEESTAEPVVKLDSYRDDHHVNLTWRSWMVVL